ncbi:MAG TPA: NTP transferase domain-containing protein [Flavobacteriales bacterium]|nr:NTP transferase domain-containing protein [Flavobacteriales bacterium]
MASLIILAAGRSTRFGRPKQLEPVTPDGRTIIDLTMAEAAEAGCRSMVLVSSPALEPDFRLKYGDRPHVRIAVQQMPLGTADAALRGLSGIDGTAVVVNGDDHYGHEAIGAAMGHALGGTATEHALVAYRLDRTLSPSGGVNRALCTLDGDGYLASTEEVRGIREENGFLLDEAGARWSHDRLASMNLWIFRSSLFPLFAELSAVERQGEYGLPEVVQIAIARGHRFRVIPTDAQWTGLTFADDANLVRRNLSRRQDAT